MSNLEARLADLERDVQHFRRRSRRDRWIVGGMAGVVAMLVIGGSGEPANVLDEVRTKRLVVIDDKGKSRAILTLVSNGSPVLGLWDDKNKSRMSLTLGPDGSPALALRDDNGTDRAGLTVLPSGNPALSLSDDNGNTRVFLSLSDGSPRLRLADGNGQGRVGIGAIETTSPDGTKTKFPESTIMLFGPDEKVIWKAP